MKLHELMEATTSTILGNITIVHRSSVEGVIDFSKLKHLGSGVEGDVYAAKQNGVAIKVVRIQGGMDEVENNAYLQYASLCMKNTNNPFYPRIKSVRLYEAPAEGGTKHPAPKTFQSGGDHPRAWADNHYGEESNWVAIIVMEQLEALDDISITVAEKIYNRLGLTTDAIKSQNDRKKRGNDVGLVFVNALGLHPRTLERIINTSTNRNFVQALKELTPLFKRFRGDTHVGNFMFRKTGSGRQLVITDPVI